MLISFPVYADSVALSDNYGIMVLDIDSEITALREFTAAQGGYVKYFDSNYMIVRIPAQKGAVLKEFLKRTAYITNEVTSRNDYTSQIIDLKSSLKAKEQLLNSMYAIFKDPWVQLSQTLEVEQEIGAVITEIERLKGEITYYGDSCMFREVKINYSKKSAVPFAPGAVSSQWFWINSLGIENLVPAN